MNTILISGAARGIGLELVRLYAEKGARVHACARSLDRADELHRLAQGNPNIVVHEMDVASDESVQAAAAEIGDERIDVLHNVAGVLGGIEPELAVGSSDWDEWHRMMAIMVMGPLRVLQAFVPKMERGAKVINFSSQIAASTWASGGLYSYAAAKAALNRMMRSAATDLKGRGIVVGLLHPGYVQTDMGGPDAEISPRESAEGVYTTTEDWTLDQSGAFRNWNGTPHAW